MSTRPKHLQISTNPSLAPQKFPLWDKTEEHNSGHWMDGGVLSSTIMLNAQLAHKPKQSATLHITRVLPRPKKLPLA